MTTSSLHFSGIHHVSALTARAERNHAFYTQVLGLRLVKKTVNQDDPQMYHLFYADGAGSAGSDMTFFDFPRAAREHRGNDSITRTTFRVTGREALAFWAGRLTREGVPHGGIVTRDSRLHLDFEDSDGTRLSLIDDGGEGPRGVINPLTDIPAAFQIQGLGYSGFTVADLAPTRAFFERGLNLREVRTYPTEAFTTHVFQMGEGGPHAELHVTGRDDLPRHRPGAGGVHHVALRVRDEAELRGWLAHLEEAGYPNSGQVNRHYFQSVYIRDPNGLVIELATDGPGFTTDEALETLGERLALPPFLEPRRAAIEAHLRPLSLQGA
ncbi:ring-cleaving dioxygenase (plasmid) [Deinococcus metallilatus]|uniref:Glyoxalase family protein n=1 Tax=Deinococcus metallilatus TaxID=1211322 RepID=A0ABR6MNM3_9DEIO|nr:ring-cleaving dioxygenase [Deinococcus metallilatus]MBB5293535.1 glyoxalase family protein [Deinococcus metallilatus]QBY06610.1 ring-cleaving dioxygenase [Deinococcus metallilatus]RXJ17953.1 ring-cleaving dioxygenase [Deinococcus metallilatus]GMA15244.1 glyoxalase [Deinococcus metallilatus]